jgi:phosphoribosylformylglycinamidine cyclo-ligase
MFNTFNMGVGMSIVVKKGEEEKALGILRSEGEDAYVIGRIEACEGDERIVII